MIAGIPPPADEGGDPPCWAHLFEAGAAAEEPPSMPQAVVVDLGTVTGEGGAIWSVPHGGDLDANFVRLPAGGRIAEHVNHDVDVLMFVQSGSGRIAIDGTAHALRGDVVALVPRSASRTIEAGPAGLSYLSVHRRRGPLTIRTSGSRRGHAAQEA